MQVEKTLPNDSVLEEGCLLNKSIRDVLDAQGAVFEVQILGQLVVHSCHGVGVQRAHSFFKTELVPLISLLDVDFCLHCV